MKFNLSGIALTIAILALAFPCRSQDTLLHVYGLVKDFNSKDSIPFPEIIAYDVSDISHVVHGHSDLHGRYNLYLSEIRVYRILFTVPGYLSKNVEVDLHGPTPEQFARGYVTPVDMLLLKPVAGVDLSLLNEPIGKATFDPMRNWFTWNLQYTESIRKRIDRIIEEGKKDP